MRRTGSHEQGYTDTLVYTHAQVYRLGKRFAMLPSPSFAMLPSGSSKHGLRASRQNISWGRTKWRGREHRRGGSGSGANTNYAAGQEPTPTMQRFNTNYVEIVKPLEMGWGLMEKTGWSEAGGGGGLWGDLGRCPTCPVSEISPSGTPSILWITPSILCPATAPPGT
jgi:hypothetical protein